MNRCLILLFVLCHVIVKAYDVEKKSFKKFKGFKRPQWHMLQKHTYRDLTPLKQHKFRVSHKRSNHMGKMKKSNHSQKNFIDQISKALENSNVSVENHVHSQALKSHVMSQSKQQQQQQRSFLDTLTGANISIENHVHSQASKSHIKHSPPSARSLLSDALRNANISVENSVHSYTARRRHLHKKHALANLANALKNANISVENSVHSYTARRHLHKKHALANLANALKNANISVENSVHSYTAKRGKLGKKYAIANLASALKNTNISVENSVHSYTGKKRTDRSHVPVDVTAHKRDEEPFDDNGVQLKGKSAMEVAAEIESNDQSFIPMLSSTSSNNLKKDTEEALGGRSESHDKKQQHSEEAGQEEKPEYIISDKADAFDEYQMDHPTHKKADSVGHEKHEQRHFPHEKHREYNRKERERESYGETEHASHKERNEEPDEENNEPSHETSKYRPTGVQSYNGGQREDVEDEVSSHHMHEDTHDSLKSLMNHHDNLADEKPSDFHDATSAFSKERPETRVEETSNSREDEQHAEEKIPENENRQEEENRKPEFENDERESSEHTEEQTNAKDENNPENEQLQNFHENKNPSESDHGSDEFQNSDSVNTENHDDNSEGRNDGAMKMFDSKSNFVDQMKNMEGHDDDENMKSFSSQTEDCEDRRHGICKESNAIGRMPDRRQLDLDTNKQLSQQEKMIEFQRNPFDPHDNIDMNREDGEDPHHEAINSPIPQSVLQIGVDPTVNLHYLSRTEHQDLHEIGNPSAEHERRVAQLQAQDVHTKGRMRPEEQKFTGESHSVSNWDYQRDAPKPHEAHSVANWDYQRDAPKDPHEDSPFNHRVQDMVHHTSDNGHFDWPKENNINRNLPQAQAMLMNREPSEHEKTFPATPQQQPLMPMFTPPERQLPMFQVGHPHGAAETQEGARRSPNTLTSGQVYEFGNRDYANYLHQHLSEYLKQAAYDYKVMGLETPDLGIEAEIARRRKLENDAQVVLNETEILKQLRDNSTDITIFDGNNVTENSNSTLANKTVSLNNSTNNITQTNTNNTTAADNRTVRKHLIPETTKLKALMLETAQSLANDLDKRSNVNTNITNNTNTMKKRLQRSFIFAESQDDAGS